MPTSSTAANRLRITVAATAAPSISRPTTGWTSESHSRKSGWSRAPRVSTTTGNSTSVDKITAWVAGIEPRWVTAVSRTEATSAPRTTAS